MFAVRPSGGASTGSPDDADLARRAAAGDRDAFGLLFERWFDRVFDVAWHVVHNRDTAAEVAQDAFAGAWQQIGTLRQPESFGGWLLRIARNRALNRLQRERRSSPVGDEEAMVTLDPRSGLPDPADPVADQERDDLVWVASRALGDDDASLLNLHLRFGLGPAELAGELGVQPNAVHQRLFRLKNRLAEAIGAWVLWRRGLPSCPRLRAALEEAQVHGFDRDTAAAVLGHARRCDDCTEERRLQLSPEVLFSSVPIVAAGPLLRAKVVAALQGAGVPAGGAGLPGASGPPPSGTGPGSPGAGSAGGPAPTGGTDAAGTPGADGPPVPGPGWRAKAVVLAVVLAVLFAVGAGVAARAGGGGDDGDGDEVLSEREATDSSVPPDAGPTDRTPSGGTKDPPATPDSTAPTTPPDTGEPPPDTTTTTTTTVPTAPPVIGGFRVSRGTQTCSTPSQAPVVFTWSSTGGTSATLGPTGGPASAVEPSGTSEACAISGTEWTLVVTGDAGSDRQTATVP